MLIAFKADKRYFRVLELDYRPTLPVGASVEADRAAKQYVDEAKAWTGKVLLERSRNLQAGGFAYRSVPAEMAQDCFPPTSYLRNVGLAVPDPTGKDEARRNLQQIGFLPELLKRCAYEALEQTKEVGGAACVVLEGDFRCGISAGESGRARRVADKLWLDIEHGLALRQRDRRVDGRLVRVVNRDFVEVFEGLWLPKQSRTESWAPPDAPREYRNSPVLVRRMRLLLWVVNRVPDDLFDTALTEFTPQPVPAFKLAPAYHWREIRFEAGDEETTDEGWAVRGVGRRVEMREGSKLRLLAVDTPRWHFVWSPARNRVTASPSRLGTRTTRPWQVRNSVPRFSEPGRCVPAFPPVRRSGSARDKLTE